MERVRALATEGLRRATYGVDAIRAPVRRRLIERARRRPPSRPPVPVVFLLIYRARNVEHVEMLIRQAGADADIRLWALDEVVPGLAALTLGCGGGGRLENLGALYDARPAAPGSWLVIADDDVVFTRGDVGSLIRTMMAAGLSLAGAGQSILAWWTQVVSLGRPFAIASDTDHVESGPLVVADPAFAAEILPFLRGAGMGWGIEADWYRLKQGRYRIGVVDACRVMHLGQFGNYSYEDEGRRAAERLAAAGLESIWQLRRCNARWWRWQRTPPWGAPAGTRSK